MGRKTNDPSNSHMDEIQDGDMIGKGRIYNRLKLDSSYSRRIRSQHGFHKQRPN